MQSINQYIKVELKGSEIYVISEYVQKVMSCNTVVTRKSLCWDIAQSTFLFRL
jgi:hypothetical protein